MTSVLYSAGLNYQAGNPLRQEIVQIRREVESLRKQNDLLLEENQVYRKYLMKLLAHVDGAVEDSTLVGEFSKDIMALSARDVSSSSSSSSSSTSRPAGNGTVQGGGFRR